MLIHATKGWNCCLALAHRRAALQAEAAKVGAKVAGQRAAAREDALQQLAAVLHLARAWLQWIGFCPAALKDLHAVALLQLLKRADHLLVVHLYKRIALISVYCKLHHVPDPRNTAQTFQLF